MSKKITVTLGTILVLIVCGYLFTNHKINSRTNTKVNFDIKNNDQNIAYESLIISKNDKVIDKDESGNYILEPGNYNYQITYGSDYYHDQNGSFVISDEDIKKNNFDINVPVIKKAVLLDVNVTTLKEQLIAKYTINITKDNQPILPKDDGYFWLETGEYQYEIIPDGFQYAPIKTAFTIDDETLKLDAYTLNVTLKPQVVKMIPLVVDHNNHPITDFDLKLSLDGEAITLKDDGYFWLKPGEYDYELDSKHPLYGIKTGKFSVNEDILNEVTFKVDFDLKKIITQVKVNLVTPNDEPINNYKLEIYQNEVLLTTKDDHNYWLAVGTYKYKITLDGYQYLPITGEIKLSDQDLEKDYIINQVVDKQLVKTTFKVTNEANELLKDITVIDEANQVVIPKDDGNYWLKIGSYHYFQTNPQFNELSEKRNFTIIQDDLIADKKTIEGTVKKLTVNNENEKTGELKLLIENATTIDNPDDPYFLWKAELLDINFIAFNLDYSASANGKFHLIIKDKDNNIISDFIQDYSASDIVKTITLNHKIDVSENKEINIEVHEISADLKIKQLFLRKIVTRNDSVNGVITLKSDNIYAASKNHDLNTDYIMKVTNEANQDSVAWAMYIDQNVVEDRVIEIKPTIRSHTTDNQHVKFQIVMIRDNNGVLEEISSTSINIASGHDSMDKDIQATQFIPIPENQPAGIYYFVVTNASAQDATLDKIDVDISNKLKTIIQPNTNENMILQVRDSYIVGKNIKKSTKITSWINLNDYFYWSVEFAQPGNYLITANIGATNSGGHLVVSLNDDIQLDSVLPRTLGGWQSEQSLILGTITIKSEDVGVTKFIKVRRYFPFDESHGAPLFDYDYAINISNITFHSSIIEANNEYLLNHDNAAYLAPNGMSLNSWTSKNLSDLVTWKLAGIKSKTYRLEIDYQQLEALKEGTLVIEATKNNESVISSPIEIKFNEQQGTLSADITFNTNGEIDLTLKRKNVLGSNEPELKVSSLRLLNK